MIRHFSPFHAPLTPPLMGMDGGKQRPARDTQVVQRRNLDSEGTTEVFRIYFFLIIIINCAPRER